MPKRRCLAAGPKGEGGHAEGPRQAPGRGHPSPTQVVGTDASKASPQHLHAWGPWNMPPWPSPPTVGLLRGSDHGRRVPGHLPCVCLLPLESQWPALALAQAPLEQGQPPPTDPDLFTAGKGAVCSLHQTMLSLGQRLLLPSAWGLSGAGGGLPLAVGGACGEAGGATASVSAQRRPAGGPPDQRLPEPRLCLPRCRGKLA